MHLEDRRRERGGWLYIQSKMHRWILYGNVYQRPMNYTPSWNIETKVGGGLMDAFKYFFYHVLVFCWFCFASLIQGSTVSPTHRWPQEVSLHLLDERTANNKKWWAMSESLPVLWILCFFFPFVIVCSHLCCIVSTCVSSPMATVCARPPLLSGGLFAFHLFDLKEVPVCCVIFLHLFNC